VKGSLLAVAILAIGAATFTFVRTGRQPLRTTPAAAAEAPAQPLVTGPGRVEPASEELRVGAEIEGRLERVADEGSHLSKGDVLATLTNTDFRARVDLAQADLAAREAELQRLLAGSRDEERREAAAAVQEAEAALSNARAEAVRYQTLYSEQLTAREQLATRETAQKQAEARLQAAREHQAFVDASARREDVQRAEAQVEWARSQLAEARALLDKTTIRAPIDGVVLRRHYRAGETVPPGAPIVTMGDVSRLRVRMEMDERDIARVHLGQPVYCISDAYGSRRFSGKIVRLGQMLGRKNINTDDPAERSDTKVLEALIELDPGARLTPGLRVDVFVQGQ
jgi:HlyD family secretion protein